MLASEEQAIKVHSHLLQGHSKFLWLTIGASVFTLSVTTPKVAGWGIVADFSLETELHFMWL